MNIQNYLNSMPLELRPYQKTLIEQALQHKEGIIAASTGAGKSVIYLEIIRRLGLTATILTPNTALMEQMVQEAKQWYGWDVGRIFAKEKEIKPVTVSTFQSLFDNSELLQQLALHTSVLIIDEAHGVVSRERRRVIEAFRPSHLYGGTGSAYRDDGQTDAIFFIVGPILGSYEQHTYSPDVEMVESGVAVPLDAYAPMVTLQTENKSRNTLISGLALGELTQGRKVIVLTKRVRHAELIKEKLPMALLIGSNDKQRNEILLMCKKDPAKFGILVGTTSLLATGIDIPSLDTLILACDMKGEVLTTQSVGRIMRLFEGKPTPKIIDICDGRNPVFRRQALVRKSIYIKRGWNITTIPYTLQTRQRVSWSDVLPA
jgi:superfamily II DNA or RNA helicase